VALLTACLAQAASRPLPWCADAEVNPRPAALSVDPRWILTVDATQEFLTLFDDQLNPVRRYPLLTRDGQTTGAVHLIVDASPRNSFIVVMRNTPEVWEISYDPNADPIFDGLVHDYRMGEGLARPGFLGLRRTLLRQALAAPYFTADYRTLISLTKNTDDGGAQARIVNLDVRREIATATLAQWPEPNVPFAVTADGRTWHADHGQTPAPESIQRLRRYCTP
jgi:hypothetical protein